LAVSYEHLVWLMESLDKYNATLGDGITRYTFSAEYEAMREFVIDQMEEIGLSVNIDGFGNTFGTLETENTSLPPVYIGSHIDSVPRGGRFDGVLGVLAAIETARTIVLDSTRLTRPLVVVIFAEEEGGRFGQVMAGSRALVGRLSKKQLYELKDAQGITYEQALATHGYSNMPWKVLTPGSVHCMLEAHIEQSVVLERNRKTIGIVESIAGIQQSTMEAGEWQTTPAQRR